MNVALRTRLTFPLAALLSLAGCASHSDHQSPDGGADASIPTASPDFAVAGAADGGGADGGSGPVTPSTKKGYGLPKTPTLDDGQLRALGIAWFYDWGSATTVKTQLTFVPMIFSANKLSDTIMGPVVLGFNEPDNAGQSNMPVQTALDDWAQVVAKAARVGAPGVAGNAATGTWLPPFMQGTPKPKVDFIPIHWYKGPKSALFISDVTAVIQKYNLPVWITEFAPQTISQATANPTQYTQVQVDQFIAETVAWMEQQPQVERYAWHDSGTGTSSLIDGNGALTASGKSYAAAH